MPLIKLMWVFVQCGNLITKQNQIQMRGIRLAFVVLLIGIVASHPVKDSSSSQKEVVKGYVNQARQIPIPFKKCFKAETEIQANSKYIEFKPTRIEVNMLKRFSLKNQGSKISVLEDLLSPIIYKHGHTLVFDGFMMVFLAPKTVIIVEETSAGFQVKNRYKIQNLDRFEKFKVYQLGNKGLLVVYNQKKAYMLDQLAYEEYQFPDISTIIHLTELSATEFYAAEFMKGLVHYKLDSENKKIDIVKAFTGEMLNLGDQFRYVVDVSLNFYKEGIILVLDAELGLVELLIKDNQISSKVAVSHKMCESFDSVQRSHVVLLCQNQGHSTIIEAYRQFDKKTKEFSYRKLQPIFQANYLNDLHVTDSYYLVYSYKNIRVFWNTRKHRLPETLETQSQIVLPGLETFTFTRNLGVSFLYTVQGGVLFKYRLEEKAAQLTARVQQPISKEFKLFIYGSCEDIELSDKKESKVQACRLSRTIALQIGEEEYPREQDFGISATIIAILIIVFLLVIWICLKKYKGLEQEARKVLKNYQNKRINAARSI